MPLNPIPEFIDDKNEVQEAKEPVQEGIAGNCEDRGRSHIF